ncbi:MAG: hypothetical protein ACTSWY_09140 [Promethearchaeota archaeon]
MVLDTENKKMNNENINSLEELRDFLKKIEREIDAGQYTSSDINFIPIFKRFQTLISQNNLEKGVSDFGDISEVFKRKIGEIQNYISRIAFNDSFKIFLLNHKNNESLFSAILTKCWKTPLILEDYNEQYFSSSFQKLVMKKKRYIKKEILDPEKVEIKGIINFDYINSQESFQESLNEFFKFLRVKLPCKFNDLFSEAPNSEKFFNWFNYCLHLIQKHRIFYNKKSGIISEVDTYE